MRLIMLATCATVFLCSGCYHVTVITDSSPTTGRISKPWQMSFVAGLVPPSEIQANEEGCASGVTFVHTWRSFPNMLVGSLSQSLVTPMSVEVGCASNPPTPDAETPSEGEKEEPTTPPVNRENRGG